MNSPQPQKTPTLNTRLRVVYFHTGTREAPPLSMAHIPFNQIDNFVFYILLKLINVFLEQLQIG